MSIDRFVRAAVVTLALVTGGCEWFDTMSDPADIQPHEREPWAPPEGSVPLDGLPEYTLADVEGLLTNPVEADSASTAVGAAYYRGFCSVCHGVTGLGNGPISGLFPAIPAIATGTVAGMSDAYLFALITQGRGLMPSYERIPETARWDLVNYLRTMEAAPADTAAARASGGASAADTAAGGAP
ncbi:MAG: cytochrome c [Gemmatimonadetes bacterium]|nr:cytochrome c [Gemmatimonadota bacterium]